jgi:HAD superfamily phosphatase (TIGR01668 family)
MALVSGGNVMAWSRLLVPGAVVSSVTAIAPQALRRKGICAMVVDLDNTLTVWNERQCAAETVSWLQQMLSGGISVCIASNNGVRRVRDFSESLGLDIPWVAHAGKPRARAYQASLRCLGTPAEATAAVGDQVFTDVLGGNMAGMFTILVQPLGRREFVATRGLRVVESLWLKRLHASGLVTSL